MLNKVHCNPDAQPLNLSDEDKKTIMELIDETMSQLSFFKDILDEIDSRAVDIHMQLLEYTVANLSDITGYNAHESEKAQKRTDTIQKLNQQVRELEQQIGSTMTPNAVSSGLSHYEDIFRCWYEALGFYFATTEFIQYGLKVDFSSELIPSYKEVRLAHNKEFAQICAEHCANILDSEDIQVDKEPGSIGLYLMDTDQNRECIKKLFQDYLPGSRIVSFSSIEDHNVFLLRFKAVIPFESLAELKKTLMSKAAL